MIKNKKQMLAVVGAFTLILMLGTVTYAFFNYTRTGVANTISTGRIYFNTSQDGRLNMTNIFPMSSTAAAGANLDSVDVRIYGDTTYADGEEFEITLTNVVNTIGSGQTAKTIPINYIATYVATPVEQGEDPNNIGTSSDDYFNDRGSVAAKYMLNATGEVKEGAQVLAGYIPTGATGIDGTLTIKAYVDANRIAISDTYPEQTVRTVKTTGYSSSACETVLTGVQDADEYCATASSLQDAVDDDLTDAQISLLVNAGIVEEYTDGTTSEWVRGRTVLTTTEWNSLQNTPLSFKIKAVAKQGTWVEEPEDGTIDSCQDCQFLYTTNMYPIGTTTDDLEYNEEELSLDYRDAITSNRKYFLGIVIENDEVVKAYACGIKGENPNQGTPFCIEGSNDGSTNSANEAILSGNNGIYGNTCDDDSYGLQCDGIVSAIVGSAGNVEVGSDNYHYCYMSYDADFGCNAF